MILQLWNNVRIAFGDQPDLVELAENLSQNFELLYNEEVGNFCTELHLYSCTFPPLYDI